MITVNCPLLKEFRQRFKKNPEIFVHSPGRINIIGEHSDYHDGYVMPAAIDLGIDWLVAKNNLKTVRGYSLNTNEGGYFEINDSKKHKIQWLQYLQGVIEVLKQDKKEVGGVDIVIQGNLPMGNGLSSSSSLAAGFAFILSQIFNLELSLSNLTDVGCRAEWWFGTRGGNMDHFAILHGLKSHALFFDPRYFQYEYIPIPKDVSIVVFETTIRHNQKFSPYAQRRKQAEQGLNFIQKKFPQKRIVKLRDVSLEILEKVKKDLDNVVYRRCFHAVSERGRVIKAKQALKNRDFQKIKDNMSASHKSLRDNYEVSCKELDIAFEEALKIDGIIASRMTGGGFGGCTVNLVEKNKAEKFVDELKNIFQKKTKLNPKAYICFADNGIKAIKQ